MTKRYDLAAIVNRVSEEDLAGLAPGDALVLLQGLPGQPADRAVTAARKRLATSPLRNTGQEPGA
ncbi:MAG: hypothetical protein WAN86_07950 [Hyphomicrobiaceae bacterium]